MRVRVCGACERQCTRRGSTGVAAEAGAVEGQEGAAGARLVPVYSPWVSTGTGDGAVQGPFALPGYGCQFWSETPQHQCALYMCMCVLSKMWFAELSSVQENCCARFKRFL